MGNNSLMVTLLQGTTSPHGPVYFRVFKAINGAPRYWSQDTIDVPSLVTKMMSESRKSTAARITTGRVGRRISISFAFIVMFLYGRNFSQQSQLCQCGKDLILCAGFDHHGYRPKLLTEEASGFGFL